MLSNTAATSASNVKSLPRGLPSSKMSSRFIARLLAGSSPCAAAGSDVSLWLSNDHVPVAVRLGPTHDTRCEGVGEPLQAVYYHGVSVADMARDDRRIDLEGRRSIYG